MNNKWESTNYNYPHCDILKNGRHILTITDTATLPAGHRDNVRQIVRALNVFADIEEGVSMIVRKDHYYQLEAQAKAAIAAGGE